MYLNEYHKQRIKELKKLAEKEKEREITLEEVETQVKSIREGRKENSTLKLRTSKKDNISLL